MYNTVQEEIKKVQDYILKNNRKDISLDSVKQQLDLFISGISTPRLAKPCTIGDGIFQLKEEEHFGLTSAYKSAANAGRLMKFVPASGAASRMFQKPQSVLNQFQSFTLNDLKESLKSDNECKSVYEFLTNLSRFAFYYDLKTVLSADDFVIEKLINKSPAKILKAVLFEGGLNYSFKPKGAIKFHQYKNECRTAFEEHIYEAFHYIKDISNTVKIHFTISEEHTEMFNSIIQPVINLFAVGKNQIKIDYSYQKKSTDTIAVSPDNKIIFNENNNIVFRPAGHGALLENLNDLNADIVFIKNIDNLSVEALSAETIKYKKLLAGFLVMLQKQIFDYLNTLGKETIEEEKLNEIITFSSKFLSIQKPKDYNKWDVNQKKEFIFKKLNRPLRVCGMVQNDGEPGGGPFWVKSEDGNLSLQIVEQVQINLNDNSQKKIFNQSTHFNPVDLVCGLRDYKGKNFDLLQYRDPESGIITKKSKDGVELKALELPGLWNGGMAYWNTVFVEVPISTFNPVKEINDLLKPAHQS